MPGNHCRSAQLKPCLISTFAGFESPGVFCSRWAAELCALGGEGGFVQIRLWSGSRGVPYDSEGLQTMWGGEKEGRKRP